MYILAPKRHRKLNNSIFKNAEEFQAQNIFFVFRLRGIPGEINQCFNHYSPKLMKNGDPVAFWEQKMKKFTKNFFGPFLDHFWDHFGSFLDKNLWEPVDTSRILSPLSMAVEKNTNMFWEGKCRAIQGKIVTRKN